MPTPPMQRRLKAYLRAADPGVYGRFRVAIAFIGSVAMPAPSTHPRISPGTDPAASASINVHPQVPEGVLAVWTGREARLLRQARRMGVRNFAAHLGVSDRMVSKWDAGGVNIRPRAVNQEVLDTSLRLADEEARARFFMGMGTG